jgi:hypothetical protein
LTDTGCEPMDLMCPPVSMVRLSTEGPPAALIAAATSMVVMEPNSFVPSPVVRAVIETVSFSSACFTWLACSVPRISRASWARLIVATCFSAPFVATMALLCGSRKFRP